MISRVCRRAHSRLGLTWIEFCNDNFNTLRGKWQHKHTIYTYVYIYIYIYIYMYILYVYRCHLPSDRDKFFIAESKYKPRHERALHAHTCHRPSIDILTIGWIHVKHGKRSVSKRSPILWVGRSLSTSCPRRNDARWAPGSDTRSVATRTQASGPRHGAGPTCGAGHDQC